jgi:hypothetical protein
LVRTLVLVEPGRLALTGLIQALNLGRDNLIGHSYGGLISLLAQKLTLLPSIPQSLQAQAIVELLSMLATRIVLQFVRSCQAEPWGVSPQDALIAGLGLVTSDRVGAGLVFLEGDLARFVVPLSDNAAAVERMIELCDHPAGAARFAAARAKAEGYTVVSCASRWAGLSIE